MTEYGSIANKFGRVRRAWKRTAALSGLAVVLLESIGLLTTAILVDLLFMPGLFGRVIILFVLAISFIYLLYKNTIKPILRHIEDKQIALYVEEHYPKFEGALIAAAEFGPQADLDPEKREIINTILKEAETRAQKFDLRKSIDFSRFKKYGIMALGLFIVYMGLSVAFPDTATKRIERVLSPWTAEKKEQKNKITSKTIAKTPIEFTLSKQTANILRGTPFKLEVTLNRAPNTKVKLHFRSKMDAKTKGKTPWNAIPMEEIDKLHGYSVNLPDVNESMEFFVSAEGYESTKNNIEVYDPLIVENMVVVTQFPAYLKRPDKTENSPTGEIYAIAGSKITVKIITNRPLYEGKITIGNDQIIPATISDKNPEVAIATFDVNDSSNYTYRLEDGFGQIAESPAPAQIEVIKDGKPKIELIRPTEMLAVTPLGEVEIEAKATDDFGIASVNLVYMRGADVNAKKQYIPIPLAEKGADDPVGSQDLVYFWEMEKIKPKLKPQEVLTWYLEVKDRKGQTDETEIAFLPITHFETWATEGDLITSPSGGEQPPAIDSILIAAWQVRLEKDMLSPKEFEQRIKDVAQIMVKPSADGEKSSGAVWQFLSPEKFPENPEFVTKINGMCVQAHGLLAKLKLNEGIDVLRAVVTELIAMGLLENIVMPDMKMAENSPQEATSEFKANMEQLQQMESEASPKGKAAEKQTEKDIKAAEKAKEAEKKTAELEKKQDELVKKAKELAKNEEGSKGKGKDAKDAKAEKAKKELAEKQKDIAEAAKKAAKEIKKDAKADSKAANAAKKLEVAAKKMDEAAKAMKENNMAKGLFKAEEARKDLVDIKDDLMGLSQEKVAKLLEELEQKTEKALRKQNEIQKNTENLAKNIEANKDNKPNAKQERDFGILTNKQAEMRNNVEEIKKTIEDIDKMSKEGRMKPETANQMEKAKKDMRRSRLEKKITNASVELARKQAKPAAQEQKEAKDGLKKVLESIRAASDSLASDYESELRRANNEAKRVKQALEQLNPKAADKAKAPEDKQAQKDKKDEKAVTQEERKEKVEEASVTIGLLKRHLNRRKFLDKETLDKLEKSTGTPVNLEKALKDDSKEAVELQKLIARIHNKLEAEYEMHVASKRLFTAQREDCPPQYRHMVNKYFEKLSVQKK